MIVWRILQIDTGPKRVGFLNPSSQGLIAKYAPPRLTINRGDWKMPKHLAEMKKPVNPSSPKIKDGIRNAKGTAPKMTATVQRKDPRHTSNE
jgi:hypothetical protein